MKRKLYLLLPSCYLFFISTLSAQLFIDTSYTAEQMIMDFFNNDSVTVSNISFQGGDVSLAYFEGANTDLGIPAGIMITSGNAYDAIGPNDSTSQSTNLDLPGSDVIDHFASLGASRDATVISMNLVSQVPELRFEYVFGSEEYEEFVGTQFNDLFVFTVNDFYNFFPYNNVAMIPGLNTPVAINTVNQMTNTQFYRPSIDSLAVDYQYDGFTTVLPASFSVTPGELYIVNIGVADLSDHIFDSGVFISVESLTGDSLLTPPAMVEFTQNQSVITLENQSRYATSYHWDYGDGTTSTERHPVFHNYSSEGDYTITLITNNYCCSDTTSFEVSVDSLTVDPVAILPISFSNETNLLLPDPLLNSGLITGVSDMNNDGLDDIIRLRGGRTLQIDFQNPDGGLFTSYFYGIIHTFASIFSVAVADVDENGLNDIAIGHNGVRIFKAENNGFSHSPDTVQVGTFTQGINFVDINNDGAIDLFECNDLGLNNSFASDGLGNFTADTNLINTESTIPSDNSGNYASIWTDYDNDGDMDMYLSKCRTGVSDPLDGRRVNMLFQNNDGVFTDVAEAANLRPLSQSWASNFGDIDNDGDMDCFIVNHQDPSRLYLNNGDGTFSDITAASGIADSLPSVGVGLHILFADFNNDTHLDMLYTGFGGNHQLFKNNGDRTFTSEPTAFPIVAGIQTAAFGDLNHDGFVDVYAGLDGSPDRLFINNGNDYSYFNVLLEGQAGYRNGIGAKVELYGIWGKQIREVRSGESYGIMNSLSCHFGLGTAISIDSMVVKWPSGTVDRLCNPAINQHLSFTEGTAPRTEVDFSYTNESLILNFTSTVGGSPDNLLWDFGDGNTSTTTNPSYTYNDYGTYEVSLTANDDCGMHTTTQSINIVNPLPVELLDFRAKVTEQEKVLLSWQTASERNFAHFIIERSKDGQNFEAIGQTESHGNIDQLQSYTHLDDSPHKGANYYRLRMVDVDESFDYSIIRIVHLTDEATSWKIYPNPVTHKIWVEVPENQSAKSITFFNINGKKLAQPTMTLEDNNQVYQFSSFEKGMYLIRIETDSDIIVKRFIKL